MTRIVHICETAKGGPATYLNLIADAVGRLNNAIVVPESHASYVDADLRQYRYPRHKRGLSGFVHMIRASFTAVREERPDLLFFHSTLSLLALLALRMAGVRKPMLYCGHGWAAHRYTEGTLKRRLVMRIEGWLTALPDRVVCVSKFDMAFARAHGYRGNFELIENAVPDRRAGDIRTDLFAPRTPADAKLNLVFVGRFDRQKGLDVLLASAERLQNMRPDIHFHILGAAVLDAPSVHQELNSVTFHGWVARSVIDDWYASADALVVPSRWEGLPLVIPEAYRNGTPVIASTSTGIAALVHEGKTGYTFDLSERNLTAILEVVTRDTLREMRPAVRRLYDRRFTAERLCAELAALYEAVLEKHGTVPSSPDKPYAEAA
ncbi:MAG: glycosyltransferase family 4 protein [Devosiaceae bacterium]|nr:glycosyltransferase family 4 protein [Devosiaceae bacterium MH13]